LSNAIHVLLFVVLIVFWLGSAILAGRIADRKERIGGVYLFAALVIGPIALLAAVLLPRRRIP
jgi:uncharacterized membrane protein